MAAILGRKIYVQHYMVHSEMGFSGKSSIIQCMKQENLPMEIKHVQNYLFFFFSLGISDPYRDPGSSIDSVN